MSDDKDNTDELEIIGGTIVPKGAMSPGVGLSGKTQIGTLMDEYAYTPLPLRGDDHTPLTITSVASLSAELLSPDQAPMIRAYQQALKVADKGDVFALSTGEVTPQDVGIKTDLKPKITQTYAAFEYRERETQESRDHDLNRDSQQTKGIFESETLIRILVFVLGIISAVVVFILIGDSGSP